MSQALPHLWRAFSFNVKYPQAKLYIASLSGISFTYAIYEERLKSQRKEELKVQKSQLTKPVYDLRDSELVSPPWNSENLDEWLYRTVRVTGRPLHYLGMYVPRIEYGKNGYEYIVPFVTKENEDQSVQEGLLVSLGFVPYEYKHIGDRFKLEDASVQTFDCFVSQIPELQTGYGNATNRRENEWHSADLKSMAEFTQFKNADKIGKVVLERVALNSPADENNMRLYNLDADHIQDYPYVKTLSGALNHRGQQPWDHNRRSNQGLVTGLLLGSLSVLLHLVK